MEYPGWKYKTSANEVYKGIEQYIHSLLETYYATENTRLGYVGPRPMKFQGR